jgi:hypothetical protein
MFKFVGPCLGGLSCFFFSCVFSFARSCVFIDWFYAAIMKGLRVEPTGRMEMRATEEEILQFGWASLR